MNILHYSYALETIKHQCNYLSINGFDCTIHTNKITDLTPVFITIRKPSGSFKYKFSDPDVSIIISQLTEFTRQNLYGKKNG